jgi:hypothetical protein
MSGKFTRLLARHNSLAVIEAEVITFAQRESDSKSVRVISHRATPHGSRGAVLCSSTSTTA